MTLATNRHWELVRRAAPRVIPQRRGSLRREAAELRGGVGDLSSNSAAARSPALQLLVGAWIVVGSLAVGGLTSVAQGVLPDSLRSLANSPSGWTLLTVTVIAVARLRLLPAACFGAVSFVCLVLGYTVVSELRGLNYSPALWGAVGLLAGPAVGWSTSAAFDTRRLLSALGSSIIAGIAITDAVYGLTVVDDTTSPVYWWIAGVSGVMFLGVVALRRQLPPRYVALQVGLTGVWIAIGSVGYVVLNSR